MDRLAARRTSIALLVHSAGVKRIVVKSSGGGVESALASVRPILTAAKAFVVAVPDNPPVYTGSFSAREAGAHPELERSVGGEWKDAARSIGQWAIIEQP
jgi:hypothetical protein